LPKFAFIAFCFLSAANAVSAPEFCAVRLENYGKLLNRLEAKFKHSYDRRNVYVALKPIEEGSFSGKQGVATRGELLLKDVNKSDRHRFVGVVLGSRPPVRILGVRLTGPRPRLTRFSTNETKVVLLSEIVAAMRSQLPNLSETELLELLLTNPASRLSAIESWEQSRIPANVLRQKSHRTPFTIRTIKSSVYFSTLEETKEAISAYAEGLMEDDHASSIKKVREPLAEHFLDSKPVQNEALSLFDATIAALPRRAQHPATIKIFAALDALKVGQEFGKSWDYDGFGSVWFKNGISIQRTANYYVVDIEDEKANASLARFSSRPQGISEVLIETTLKNIAGGSWFVFDAADLLPVIPKSEWTAQSFAEESEQKSAQIEMAGLLVNVGTEAYPNAESYWNWNMRTIRSGNHVYFELIPSPQGMENPSLGRVNEIKMSVEITPARNLIPGLSLHHFPVEPSEETDRLVKRLKDSLQNP
jgi:hypothetical protein